MKILLTSSFLIAGFFLLAAQLPYSRDVPSQPLIEGTIWSVWWELPDGNTHGLTRESIPEAIPGKNGSWNINAYGRLFETHLEIQYADQDDLGVQIVPFDRIISIRFGKGGIEFRQ